MTWPDGHSDETNCRIRAAFPAALGDDVGAVLRVLPAAKQGVSQDDVGPVTVAGERLHIPGRVYFPETAAGRVSELSETQRLILTAVYTRHHDGHVRERFVGKLVGATPQWASPFVLQLLGEYVLEIIQLLESRRDALRESPYAEFIAENPQFAALTCDRIVSYWEIYFRTVAPRFAEHPGYRLARDIGLWRRPAPPGEAGLFAPYRPRRPREGHLSSPPKSLVIRDMTAADVDPVAWISFQRNGGELAAHVSGFERALARPPGAPEELLLVALVDGRVAGYAKAGAFIPPPDAPPNCAPAGWYLTGVTIAPGMRRRGIALELTRARLALVARRADCAYYFANAMNRASIDLHAKLGFVEVTRDFWFPRTTFTGGVGVLFRVALLR